MKSWLLFAITFVAFGAVLGGPPGPGVVSLCPGVAGSAFASIPLLPSAWVDGEETLHWDRDPDRGVSVNGTYSYGGGARFTADANLTVKAVLYYLTESADDIFVHVNGQGSQSEPGPVLDTTRSTGQGTNIWRRANMPNAPAVDAGRDFWTCVIVRRHAQGMHPLTLDLGPMTPWRGGYITLPGISPEWYQLTDPPFWTDRNWDIRAVVEYETGIEEMVGPGDNGIVVLATSPVRDAAHFAFTLRESGPVRLDIFDAAGRRVHTVSRSTMGPGPVLLGWDRTSDSGARVPSGACFYRLLAGGRTDTGRIALVD